MGAKVGVALRKMLKERLMVVLAVDALRLRLRERAGMTGGPKAIDLVGGAFLDGFVAGFLADGSSRRCASAK